MAPPTSLLDSLSKKILDQWGPDMMNLTVILPNVRSGYYLKRSLASRVLGEALIFPVVLSLDEWVGLQTREAIISENEAILTLFKSFQKVKNPTEKLEEFLPLGQTIYSDWEELIRNEVPIRAIFTSLHQWKLTGIEFENFLEDEQKKLLQHFWDNVENEGSAIGIRMLELWKAIPSVYQDYLASLKKNDCCTQALAYANLAKRLPQLTFPPEGRFLFAGFGQLTKTEERILGFFLEKGIGEIVWDFHPRYRTHSRHEVNRLISRLERNPVLQESIHQSLNQPTPFSEPEIDIIGCHGLTGISQRIIQIAKKRESDGPVGLIALDSLLIPMLLSGETPEDFPFNFSMGFPLAFTVEVQQVLKILESWVVKSKGMMDLAEPSFSEADANKIQIPGLEILTQIWKVDENAVSRLELLKTWASNLSKTEIPYVQQLVSNIQDTVYELAHLLASIPDGQINDEVIFYLFQNLIRGKSLRMEGLPDKGIQVMGLFESRLLDFDHVIFAPASDALLPGAGRQSLIPDNLRRAYGLLTRSQTLEDKLFQAWRLTHRAKKITILFDANSDEKPSRLIFQLKYGGLFKVSEWEQKFGLSLPLPHLDDIAKNDFVMNQIRRFTTNAGEQPATSLSPSSLHQLLQCQLRFYFSYVLGLKMPEEGVEFGMDVRDFGNWIHEGIQMVLAEKQGDKKVAFKPESKELLNHWHQTKEKAWQKWSPIPLNQFMVELALGEKMVERFFQQLEKISAIKWKANELTLKNAHLSNESGTVWSIKGRADLVLEWDKTTTLLDLKTGSFKTLKDLKLKPGKLDSLKNKLLKNKDLFQMVMYKWLVWKNQQSGGSDEFMNEVRTVLFYMSNPQSEWLDPLQDFDSEAENALFEILESILLESLNELENPDVPFTRTQNIEHCLYCDYAGICQRR